MEHGYGIGITNRYSCFLENDDDPTDALKLAEADKNNKKKGKSGAEKENRGKDAAQSSSATKLAAAPRAAQSEAQRKGIRDANLKGRNYNEQHPNRYHADGDRGSRVQRPDRQNSEQYLDRRPRQGDREERNNRRNQEDQQSRGDSREFRTEGGGGEYRGGMRRGGFRGGRGGMAYGGRGRGGGPTPYRKREFDRQSGSDKSSSVKPIDKRDGAGSRNWGNYKDDVLEVGAAQGSLEESMDEKNDPQNAVEGEQKPATEKTAEDGLPPPAEEEGKMMTLGEYRVLQSKKQNPKPVFNLRKAGEGEDPSQWKKMTLKTKEKENDEEEEEEEEYSGEFLQRAGRQKQLLDIDFHFADSRRGNPPSFGAPRGDSKRGGGDRARRGPDGERGGGRGFNGSRGGGGFRGGYRGGRGGFTPRDDRPTRQMAPKVDDERDFPSLG